ncbi:MAG: GSCFA domain-containing protein [Bacteroidales bacterium]|nr:GSCFA domain-containing protein [Bacteroidales bacterium]MCF8392199.1 GSCFA domain-containing protein [Bacteroidales bacterium]
MNFRTEIPAQKSAFNISHKTPVLMMGSCFTDNVGSLLEEKLFPVKTNPFGVVYNPMSVFKALEIILENKKKKDADLFEFNHSWHSWDHHSVFSGPDKAEVLNKINSEIGSSHEFLKSTKYLILTFGTAWIYRLKSNKAVVCNCHKVPAKEFDRELLEISEIETRFSNLLENLKQLNPEINIILTVSPVRHWKDGAHGNQISKSILHLAIESILKRNNEDCEYFPSYEILIDDLRDYRFYADDLLHPNKQAIEYIFEKFENTYFDQKTSDLNKRIDKFIKASKHKLFDKDSAKTKAFIMLQIEGISELQEKHPYLNTKRLLSGFKNC